MVDASGGIVANPRRLRQIAGSVDTVVGILGGAYPPRQAGMAPALGAWATGTAAVEATRAWGAFVGRLHDSVDGVAVGMRAAADAYTVTDTTNARLLDKAR
jgi:hypothetical protein